MNDEGRISVLVVEDDAPLAAGIVRGLRAAGFDVELSTDGTSAVENALRARHDIVVLDLMLPERSGFEVLEHLDSRGPPVIVLTARSELEDRLRCFRLGAVDFVPKPFFVEELAARIRSRLFAHEARPLRVVRWADVELHLDAQKVTVAGALAPLTRNEMDILTHLVERAGRAVSRQQIAERVLDPLSPPDARTVDTHVARLRKKLGAAGAARIATVWGVGYRFEADEGGS
ncbi:MAG: response regulator transcription factor [Minicystis sp.]